MHVWVVTWVPWGSGPSLCPGSGLCGRSGPLWTRRTDELTAPVSSGGHGQRASQQLSCSSLCFTNIGDQIYILSSLIHLFCELVSDSSERNRHWLATHAVGSDICADMVVHSGRQSQVKESVGVISPRQSWQMSVELSKRAAIVIPASDIRVPTDEGRETLVLCIIDLREMLNNHLWNHNLNQLQTVDGMSCSRISSNMC